MEKSPGVPVNPFDGPEFDESIKDTQNALTRITEDLKSRSWNRSEPTQEGGLMVGPGSPLYGRRIMRDPKELLASFPAEMVEEMKVELATKWAGGIMAENMRTAHGELPEIKGVMTSNGFYMPVHPKNLNDYEVSALGLKYNLYPAGQVPEDERANLEAWLESNRGKIAWSASNIPKEDMDRLMNGTLAIRRVPGIRLKISVPTDATFYEDQSKSAELREQED